jgi:hypothetical protein
MWLVKPLVSIDYDGTLVESAWPMHGDWMPGAVDALHSIVKYAKVVVFTVRIAPYELDMFTPRPVSIVQSEIRVIRDRLDAVGLQEVEIWTLPYKPPAIVFVDDRGLRFNKSKNAWRVTAEKVAILCHENPDPDGRWSDPK